MAVTLKFKNLDKVVESLKSGVSTKPVIKMGVKVSGSAAPYSLVWEYGRVSCNPGPKTLWSINFLGETVVLTKTAPQGFIHVNVSSYRQFIREEMKSALASAKSNGIYNAVRKALAQAAQRCADLMSKTAPIDKGDLRSEIKSADFSVVGMDTTTEGLRIRTLLKGKQSKGKHG